MRGPIDYIIVGFEGNTFDGSILKAVGEAIDSGVIALVALIFVRKDADGAVTLVNVGETEDAEVMTFYQKYAPDNALVDDEDVSEVADLVENNTSVGLLAIEQLWAIPLRDALLKANGELISEGRIHPEAAAEIENQQQAAGRK